MGSVRSREPTEVSMVSVMGRLSWGGTLQEWGQKWQVQPPWALTWACTCTCPPGIPPQGGEPEPAGCAALGRRVVQGWLLPSQLCGGPAGPQ